MDTYLIGAEYIVKKLSYFVMMLRSSISEEVLMEIVMRGWGRNMGPRTVGSLDLSGMATSIDPNKGVYFSKPGLFKSHSEVSVAWGKTLNNSNYRVEASFSRSDVAKLFTAMFGSELDPQTLQECGLTISPQLQKQLLGQIKLADLTIGDLAGLGTSADGGKAKADEETVATVKPFLRRI